MSAGRRAGPGLGGDRAGGGERPPRVPLGRHLALCSQTRSLDGRWWGWLVGFCFGCGKVNWSWGFEAC